MKIFGGVLPFIGFRDHWMPVDDARRYFHGVTLPLSHDMRHVFVDAFECEWLGVGIILWARVPNHRPSS